MKWLVQTLVEWAQSFIIQVDKLFHAIYWWLLRAGHKSWSCLDCVWVLKSSLLIFLVRLQGLCSCHSSKFPISTLLCRILSASWLLPSYPETASIPWCPVYITCKTLWGGRCCINIKYCSVLLFNLDIQYDRAVLLLIHLPGNRLSLMIMNYSDAGLTGKAFVSA